MRYRFAMLTLRLHPRCFFRGGQPHLDQQAARIELIEHFGALRQRGGKNDAVERIVNTHAGRQPVDFSTDLHFRVVMAVDLPDLRVLRQEPAGMSGHGEQHEEKK